MSFKISIHEDISIADLIKIHNEKGVVLKTPHIGNIYPNNLAIASLGIPMLFYDRTLGTKDNNFHPDNLIVGGKAEEIADPSILTTHSKITRLPSSISQETQMGTSLVDFHMSALKRALPKSLCFTYTEYIQENKDQVLQILEKITELHPNLWSRIVNEEGKTSKFQVNNWNDVLKLGVFGLTNLKSGWLIPNPVSVLFHGTIDAAKAKVKDVYLLSGPDMYKYIDGYQTELNENYDYVRKTSGLNLPETIHCHIIPVISMRFIIEDKYRNALDELVSAYLKHDSVDESIRTLMKNETRDFDAKQYIHEKNSIKDEIHTCIRNKFEAFKATMFYDIEEASCFTQYDLLMSSGLYIHSWAINSKLTDVSRAYGFLAGCYSYVRDRLQDET